MPSNYPGFRYGADRETFSAAKVKALESLLIEKGIITGDTVDTILGYFETEMGPFNGARWWLGLGWIRPLRNCW